jgi:hypothetical protein
VVTANCQISSIADTNNPLPMMLPLSKPLLTPIAGVTRSVFSLPLALRGGAEALPTFDFGLANTRLEGLVGSSNPVLKQFLMVWDIFI